MKPNKKLKEIYSKIPEFKCKPGCTDCCGPVPFSKHEWAKVKDKRQQKGINCPYSLQGHCDIYEHRPFICRIFGTSEDKKIQCPHGFRPQKLLTTIESDKLTDEYLKL